MNFSYSVLKDFDRYVIKNTIVQSGGKKYKILEIIVNDQDEKAIPFQYRVIDLETKLTETKSEVTIEIIEFSHDNGVDVLDLEIENFNYIFKFNKIKKIHFKIFETSK